METYILIRLKNSRKKFRIITPVGKHIEFGATGYQDYTTHKDINRLNRYIMRHQRNENWNKSGINTAGFWARWLLWNKPSLQESIDDIENRFHISIDY